MRYDFTNTRQHRFTILLGLSLIMNVSAGCEEVQPQGMNAGIAMTISMPVSEDDKNSNQGILKFTHEDVDSISVDINDVALGQNMFTNIQLTKTGDVWSGSTPVLPLNTPLDFIATARDGGAVLFNGNTQVTFDDNTPGQEVIIRLVPVTDDETYIMPRVASISYPVEFTSAQTDTVAFAVEGTSGETLSYDIEIAGGGAPPFFPASGVITLAGTAGQFLTIYDTPMVSAQTDYDYEITLIDANGDVSVTTTFSTSVVPATGGDSVSNTQIGVLFNPVITHLHAQRQAGTNNVQWLANVSDDGPPSSLSYEWSFDPGEPFSPFPAVQDANVNPIILQNYTDSVYGTMDLAVTDADGGTTTIHYTVVAGQFPANPMDSTPWDGVKNVVLGRHHNCVLFKDGTMRCWGYNGYGQLGYGNTANIGDNELPYAPGDVPLPAGDSAIQIALGLGHTCALLESGYIRCWGRNNYGQLGLGHTSPVGDNEPITGPPGGVVSVPDLAIKIAAGLEHNCALLANGGVSCWGYNGYGQLGYGHTAHIGNDEGVFTAGNVDIGGTVKDIVAGENHTCVLLDSGDVRCWGRNTFGQLGYGNTTQIGDNELPTTAGNVSVGGTVQQLVAGDNHTCVLLDTGVMRCWGYNQDGQLGINSTTTIGDNEVPSSIAPVLSSQNLSGHYIAAGGAHTCAVMSTSALRCWGRHNSGQLGYGTADRNYANTNVDLDGNVPFQVSLGYDHTCTLLSTDEVWCWGYNNFGQLGYGSTTNINTPSTGGNILLFDPAP